MQIQDITYRFILARHPDGQGLGLECFEEQETADPKRVLEIFRHPENGDFLVTQFKPKLPLTLLEYAAQRAREELGTFLVTT